MIDISCHTKHPTHYIIFSFFRLFNLKHNRIVLRFEKFLEFHCIFCTSCKDVHSWYFQTKSFVTRFHSNLSSYLSPSFHTEQNEGGLELDAGNEDGRDPFESDLEDISVGEGEELFLDDWTLA